MPNDQTPITDLIASWKRHASILAPYMKQRDLFQRGQALADLAERQQAEIERLVAENKQLRAALEFHASCEDRES